MSRKQPPVSLLHLHDLTKSVWDKLKEKPPLYDVLGPSSMEDHQEDFFHPQNLFNASRNFPTMANIRTVQREAERLLRLGKTDQAARLFFLSQANTFQHLVLMQEYKKAATKVQSVTVNNVKPQSEPVEGDEGSKVDEDDVNKESIEDKSRWLRFSSFQDSDVIAQLSDLPPSWTVVQISVSHDDPELTRFKSTKTAVPMHGNPSLIVLRTQGTSVTLSRCLGPDSSACSPFLKEFADILAENTHVNRNEKNRTKYWDLRRQLDSRLKTLLQSVESRWLGLEKAQLLGSLKKDEDVALVEEIVTSHCSSQDLSSEQRARIQTLVAATPFYSSSELEEAVEKILGWCNKDLVVEAVSKLGHLATAPRNPVIFILDPHIQGLPWESLPCLSSCRQPASRLPSLPFLHTLWKTHVTDKASVVTAGVVSDSVFYVVDPDGNLPNTQQRLDKAFQRYQHWEGVTGQEPSKEQLERVLQNKDAYMFCGHGSGTKFISCDEVEKLRVHAVPLLLGCGSGQLTRYGRSLDPLGTAHSYMVASSPALVGFLWAVTDADVDQWTETFLEHWLGGNEGGQTELLQAAADKRSSFKILLNGAALVVYGLPLQSRKE